MDDKDARVREAIECCRPGSDDLRAPEMALLADAVGADAGLRATFEGIQEFDSRITRSFHDVPVPEGLEDRLLSRLAWDDGPESGDGVVSTGMAAIVDTATRQAHDEAASESADSRSEAAELDRAASPPSQRKMSPFVLSTSLAVALAAGIGMVVYFFGPSDPSMEREDFLRQARAAVAATLEQGDWSPDLTTAPADRDFPREKVAREPIGWKNTQVARLDDRAAAYLLSERIGSEVVLLVIRSQRKVAGLKPDPPWSPRRESGEQTIGAWQSDDHLYVVVVKGPNHERRYREILEDPPDLAALPRKVSPPSLIGKL